jgi:phosphoribosylformylglycinamidine cyclo-ligase
MHADGAGTKTSLAYLYYKETGDISVFRGIAQDAAAMNVDDLICVGATDRFMLSNTIDRNAHRVGGAEIIKEVIDGFREFSEKMKPFGIDIRLSGGETADVGDLTPTLIVNSTVLTRFPREKIINCNNIKPGDIIIGLASFGKASYEDSYNAGMGSNGLTAARHILFHKKYAETYPETYSGTIPGDKVYCGPYSVSDTLPGADISVGKAVLSPTRTYLPVIKEILETRSDSIHGIIHCTGGGQVKCKNFGRGLHYIKDGLFPFPPLFKAIQSAGNIPMSEMFQIFNAGHRMELYADSSATADIIGIASGYSVEAKVIGRVEESASPRENALTIKYGGETMTY